MGDVAPGAGGSEPRPPVWTVVTVTWLDGRCETYTTCRSWVRDDVLYLVNDPESVRFGLRIPLVNVRHWQRAAGSAPKGR